MASKLRSMQVQVRLLPRRQVPQLGSTLSRSSHSNLSQSKKSTKRRIASRSRKPCSCSSRNRKSVKKSSKKSSKSQILIRKHLQKTNLNPKPVTRDKRTTQKQRRNNRISRRRKKPSNQRIIIMSTRDHQQFQLHRLSSTRGMKSQMFLTWLHRSRARRKIRSPI